MIVALIVLAVLGVLLLGLSRLRRAARPRPGESKEAFEARTRMELELRLGTGRGGSRSVSLTGDAESQIRQLQELLQRGQIDDATYAVKKAEISSTPEIASRQLRL